MRFLDLFSGIGGFSIGLERAGHQTVAFCEIDSYCQRVLKRHWPNIPCYGDIRTLTAAQLASNGIIRPRRNTDDKNKSILPIDDEAGKRLPEYGGIDAICGGFPCQDISVAGKGAGIGGSRSGLWSEFRRLIGELRPSYVIVENVPALLGRGLSTVLGDLAALGYDAEWHCIPAAAVGAPHRRDRVWIVAYPNGTGQQQRWGAVAIRKEFAAAKCNRETIADAEGDGRPSGQPVGAGAAVAYPTRHVRPEQAAGWTERQRVGASGQSIANSHADGGRRDKNEQHVDSATIGRAITRQLAGLCESRNGHWFVEPDVGRVAHGVPSRVDRLRALGNAVVPQIPELIGRAIMQKPLGNGH